jgi:cation/acetate symporter
VERAKGEEVLVARIAAFAVGIISITLALLLRTANVAFLVGLAFAVAASANLPVILFSLFWKRFNTMGAVVGIGTGLAASLILILISPSLMGIDTAATAATARHLIQAKPIFPLENPGIVSIPLGFLGAYIGTLLGREPSAEAKYTELTVRANTGLGAEV